MASSVMLRRVVLLITDVSEELSASIVRVTRLFLRNMRWLLITADAVPSSPILVILMMDAIRCSKTTILTKATRRNIQEDGILHSYRRENFKSYKN
jgi:hypothetical protein